MQRPSKRLDPFELRVLWSGLARELADLERLNGKPWDRAVVYKQLLTVERFQNTRHIPIRRNMP